MRKIILCLATSLDGYIEGANGEIDWMVFNEEAGNALNSFLKEIDTILYGRISYEKWGRYVPPDEASPFERNFYEATGRMKKVVFSQSKTEFEGNPTVIKENIEERIHQLRQEDGKHIWLYGGSKIVSTMANLNLIDEFRIAIMPILLGSGKPLFSDIQRSISLDCLGITSSAAGVIELKYGRVN